MRIRLKKLAVMFAMTIIISVGFAAVQADAITNTEGAEWALSHIGERINTDGEYGAQCKDFVNAYTQENFGHTFAGHAKDLITAALPSGWKSIKNTPDFVPLPGDIAVWGPWDGNPFGHTGVIVSANKNTFDSVDQNWVNFSLEDGSAAQRVTHSYTSNNFWGVLRPPFDQTTPDEEKKIAIWDADDGKEINGKVKLWAKRNDDDSNHYAEFCMDGEVISGHVSADQGGFFSILIDGSMYTEGTHTFSIRYVNSDSTYVDSITVNVVHTITLWDLEHGQEISAPQKIWAKRKDDDPNHYAEFLLDGKTITGHLTADSSGFFAFYLDPETYSEGEHTIEVRYVNGKSEYRSERTIKIVKRIEISNLKNDQIVREKMEVFAKRYDSDPNHYAEFYVDNQLATGHLTADQENKFVFQLDPKDYEEGNHEISVLYVNSSSKSESIRQVKIQTLVEETIFDDVSKSDWFYEAIKYGVDNGLFTGLTERTFAPNETLTRGMLVTILWRLDGKPESNQTIHFSDVPASEYFYKAVRWAVQQGVTNGYEDGRFGPNDPVTREQIVVMMYRYAKKNGNAGSLEADLSSFEDREQISGYAEEAVKWALANGIMNGKEIGGKNLLDPKGNATRAEAAKLIMEFSKNRK